MEIEGLRSIIEGLRDEIKVLEAAGEDCATKYAAALKENGQLGKMLESLDQSLTAEIEKLKAVGMGLLRENERLEKWAKGSL